jgi:hypothetical protein
MYTCFFEKLVGTLAVNVKVPVEDICGNISIHYAGDLTIDSTVKIFPVEYGNYYMDLPENYPGLFPQLEVYTKGSLPPCEL